MSVADIRKANSMYFFFWQLQGCIAKHQNYLTLPTSLPPPTHPPTPTDKTYIVGFVC
jgi:hypothetical protein